MLALGLVLPPIRETAAGGGDISLWPVIAFAAFILGLGIGRLLVPVAAPPDDTGRGPHRPPPDHPDRPDPIGGGWVDDIERWLREGAHGLGAPTLTGALAPRADHHEQHPQRANSLRPWRTL